MLQLHLVCEPRAQEQDSYLLPFQTGASHPPEPHYPHGGTLMERLLVVEHNHLFREGLALLIEWERA